MTAITTRRTNISFISFLLSAIALLTLALFSFQLFNKQQKATGWVTHTYLVKLKMEETLGSVRDAETGQRGYLLTNDTSFLTPYNEAKIGIDTSLSQLSALVADNPGQVQKLKELNRLIQFRGSVTE